MQMREKQHEATEAAHGEMHLRKVMVNQTGGEGKACKALLPQTAVTKIAFCFSSPTSGHLGASP